MFSNFYQLIQKANLKNLSLVMQDTGNGTMSVVVTAQNNIGDAADPVLRAALTQMLKVQNAPTLLDEQFITHLESYSDSYVNATQAANTEQATSAMDKAATGAKKDDAASVVQSQVDEANKANTTNDTPSDNSTDEDDDLLSSLS